MEKTLKTANRKFQLADYPVKSDKEIYQIALKDWYGILASMWTAIGKPVDKKRLQIYGKDLSSVPCELLERAIKRIRLNTTFNAIPTIGEIWQAVKIELAQDNCTTPEEWIERKWIFFMGRIRYAEAVHK